MPLIVHIHIHIHIHVTCQLMCNSYTYPYKYHSYHILYPFISHTHANIINQLAITFPLAFPFTIIHMHHTIYSSYTSIYTYPSTFHTLFIHCMEIHIYTCGIHYRITYIVVHYILIHIYIHIIPFVNMQHHFTLYLSITCALASQCNTYTYSHTYVLHNHIA